MTLEDHLEDGGFGSYILECNSNIQTAGKTKIKLKSLNKNVCNCSIRIGIGRFNTEEDISLASHAMINAMKNKN